MGALQDGRNPSFEGYATGRGLDGEAGPERCTFCTSPFIRTIVEYLQTHWKGTRYQFNCLPFGLSSAPMVFTKIMLPVIAWLRQLDCRVLVYIDDNPKSIQQLSQELQFQGFNVNSVDMTICVPHGKLEKMHTTVRDLLEATITSGRVERSSNHG